MNLTLINANIIIMGPLRSPAARQGSVDLRTGARFDFDTSDVPFRREEEISVAIPHAHAAHVSESKGIYVMRNATSCLPTHTHTQTSAAARSLTHLNCVPHTLVNNCAFNDPVKKHHTTFFFNHLLSYIDFQHIYCKFKERKSDPEGVQSS